MSDIDDALIEQAAAHRMVAHESDCRPEDTINWQHYVECVNGAAEIRRLRAENAALTMALDSANCEYQQVRAENAALKADAERYEWLKQRFRVFSPHIDGMHHWCPTGDVGRITGPTLDAAIDAAIAARGAKE